MMKTNSRFARGTAAALLLATLGGCANMDDMQQRMVSGGAAGVAVGAVTTVITGGCIACGMAIGGAVGTAGGYIVHKIDQNTHSDSSPSPSASAAAPSYASASPNTNTAYSSNASNGVPQGYPPAGYGNQ